jgi:cytoskeletal protein CcmA (bactofilin family)
MREFDQANTAATGLDAHFGPGLVFDGKLSFGGRVRIDGTFTGEITTPDVLIIGDSAKVSATINCGSLIVSGEVTGSIKANDLVEMKSPARVRADVVAPQLAIDKGVLFEGSSTMQSGGAARTNAFMQREAGRRARARAFDATKKDEPTA